MQITVRWIGEENQVSESRRRDQEVLAARLRAWAGERDLYSRAAVELLLDRGGWLRRVGSTRVCVGRHSWGARIGVPAAGRYAGSRPGGPGELAVLDLAGALGQNRYRLPIIGQAGARPITAAVARDAGADR
jgi:hypothetical protein